MGLLSIALEVAGRRCLVVGGGTVARRKVDTLMQAGAHVTVVAPAVDAAIVPGDALVLHHRAFEPDDVTGMELVFACTGDAGVNAAVAHTAQEAGVWVNVADDSPACTFFVNAAVQRGALTIGVGTGGASPALARRIRETLEAEYGEAYGPFVAVLGRARRTLLVSEPDPHRRRAAFARMAALPCEDIYAAGGIDALERAVREIMTPVETRD